MDLEYSRSARDVDREERLRREQSLAADLTARLEREQRRRVALDAWRQRASLEFTRAYQRNEAQVLVRLPRRFRNDLELRMAIIERLETLCAAPYVEVCEDIYNGDLYLVANIETRPWSLFTPAPPGAVAQERG